MAESDDQDLRELSAKNICPNCGEIVQAGKIQRYGVGAFCCLKCVAEYNAAELIERHKKRLAAWERAQRS